MKPPADELETLQMEHTYEASPERVFAAWTDPSLVARWFSPADDMAVVVHELDAREGGRYRIDMVGPEGTVHQVHGTYRTVTPPERLVFTWAWADWADAGIEDSLVDVRLEPMDDGGTKLILVHKRLADEESRELHQEGWVGCLARLGRAL